MYDELLNLISQQK